VTGRRSRENPKNDLGSHIVVVQKGRSGGLQSQVAVQTGKPYNWQGVRKEPTQFRHFSDKPTYQALDTSEWSDNVGQGFDLCVIFFGNGLELFQGLFHSFFGYSAHDFHLFSSYKEDIVESS